MRTRNRSVAWKWRNGETKEVTNPVLRVLATLFILLVSVVMFLFYLLVLAVIVVFSPLWLTLHFILKAFSRKGFIRHKHGALGECEFSVSINKESFRRRF